jgi:integrase
MPGLSSFKDRHGKTRWRYRARGQVRAIPGQPGEAGFLQAYQAARDGLAKPTGGAGQERTAAGSVNQLIVSYYESRAWVELKPTTKKTYRGIIERFRKHNGQVKAASLTAPNFYALMNSLSSRPAAANNLLKVMRAVFKHAVLTGLLKADPTRDVKPFTIKGDGFPPWTQDECARFEACHARGTPQRLAYELLRHTGQRRGDVVRMGWQHINRDGWLAFVQEKTGQKVEMPMPPSLAQELEHHSKRNMSFLHTSFGADRTSKGFGAWFKDACMAAGVTDKSAHGLRKLKAIEMAEAGLPPHRIAAITGHRTLKEIERYCRAYDRAKAAGEAHATLYPTKAPEEKGNGTVANHRTG